MQCLYCCFSVNLDNRLHITLCQLAAVQFCCLNIHGAEHITYPAFPICILVLLKYHVTFEICIYMQCNDILLWYQNHRNPSFTCGGNFALQKQLKKSDSNPSIKNMNQILLCLSYLPVL